MARDKIKILFKRRRDNKSRYSANKIYVSRAELKHTNTKLLIILSTYNKQKSTFLRATRKIIYIHKIYKVLVFLKDKYIVKNSDSLTGILKSMIHKSRFIRLEKLLKNKQNIE